MKLNSCQFHLYSAKLQQLYCKVRSTVIQRKPRQSDDQLCVSALAEVGRKNSLAGLQLFV